MHHAAKVSEQKDLVEIINGSARSTELKGREEQKQQ